MGNATGDDLLLVLQIDESITNCTPYRQSRYRGRATAQVQLQHGNNAFTVDFEFNCRIYISGQDN
jgi:hypothetical protein